MKINLLKRLESSVHAFRLTIKKITDKIEGLIKKIEHIQKNPQSGYTIEEILEDSGLDGLELIDESTTFGDKVKINLKDTDTISWKRDLELDLYLLKKIYDEMLKITPEQDAKLNTLKAIIEEKVQNPINKGNKKVLIFTAFADTADYLYGEIAPFAKNNHQIESAKIVGSNQNKTSLNISSDLSSILMNFSPLSKERALLASNQTEEIDLLIATDCISEGQNLQDCDMVVNYDIHWNPVRITQRFGRIDRIGSKNERIKMINFWPDMTMEAYINLRSRVEQRMTISDMTATGQENLLHEEEEMAYREQQLKRLQKEIIDLEDVNTGVSIMDLGLTEFRMDLINFKEKYNTIEHIPNGLHTIVEADEDNEPGIIFALKNITEDININDKNRLHPFYLVYIKETGDINITHLEPKETLDTLRKLCKEKTEPDTELCELFNRETSDGRNMEKQSKLLEESIKSIIEVKEQTDIQSLFSSGGTTALLNTVKGLEDFELIAFVIVKKKML